MPRDKVEFGEVEDRSADELMTLQESVGVTIVSRHFFLRPAMPLPLTHTPFSLSQWRDVKNILLKLLQVLLPFRQWSSLHDWDLWGPLFICLALAVFAFIFVFIYYLLFII